MYVTRPTRKLARPVRRTARVPALWGGPRGGRRPIVIETMPRRFAFGDDSSSATFNASVEAWRSDVASQAGDLPIDFLLMWIQVESNGNPCSWTRMNEVGVWQ